MFSSIWALVGAEVTQFCSHFMSPLHPWMHVMMPRQPSSDAHDCVTEQHLAMTQLAHVAVVKTTPQAGVMPPAPLLPPPPFPPLPPPLLLLLLDGWHALVQLCWRQLFTDCADDRHEGLAVTFDTHACDVWAEPLYEPFGQ